MNILFMGTPDFAQKSLQALYEAKHNIIGVVTNPDKPKGRGMKMIASPVKEYAEEKGLKIYQPERVKNNPEFTNIIKELNPEIICVVAYGKILPKEILEIPRYGSVNLHGSILPKYRGAAPIQWAVLNGDKTTGVTTMYMGEGMDAGDMILKEEVQIGENETTGELWNKLADVGAKLLVKTVEEIKNGTAPREKQPEEFTIAPMLNKEMAKIDWENKTAQEIKNLIRGLNPIMGAYTFLNNKKIKFWKVDLANKNDITNTENIENEPNGTVILANDKKGLYIKTQNGILSILEIQGENAKRMPIDAFLRGNKIEAGEKFE